MRISAFQFFTLLLLAMVASPVLLAQQAASSEDQHVSADRGSPLYRRSVFAHGYIHGYEDGFHEGDIDLQTGHDARDCKHIKEFRSADAGYRHAFGSRDEFRAAYRKGFVSGYTDALAGREFRAVAAARRAATGLSELPASASDVSFDRGFRQGYESGQVHGEVTARDHAGYNSEPSACVAGSAPPPGQPQKLCDGYSRGYAMGYDDGYIASGSGIDRNTSAKNLR